MLPLYFNHTPNRQMKEMAHKALEAVGIDKQFDKKQISFLVVSDRE